MNTVSKAIQPRRAGIPLVLIVLFLLIPGTQGCNFFGPITLGCEEIPITVTPGTCTPFTRPLCFEAFNGENPFFTVSGDYSVGGDENIGFQLCASYEALSTSEPQPVEYMVIAGAGRYGRGNFLVTVVGALDVTVSDSPDPVIVGSDLTYSITLTNRRQHDVSYIEFIDRLPGSATLVSDLAENCFLQAGEVTCRDIRVLAGASVTYQFVVRPTTPGTIVNELLLFDPFLALPVTVTNPTTVNPASGADLAVTIADSPDPVIRGGILTYTITVTNNGPTTATGVRLTDLLPPLEVFNTMVSQGSFTRTGPSTIICDFGTLASGATATLTVTGSTFVTGTNTNSATATATEADPNMANNTASENTTVNSP